MLRHMTFVRGFSQADHLVENNNVLLGTPQCSIVVMACAMPSLDFTQPPLTPTPVTFPLDNLDIPGQTFGYAVSWSLNGLTNFSWGTAAGAFNMQNPTTAFLQGPFANLHTSVVVATFDAAAPLAQLWINGTLVDTESGVGSGFTPAPNGTTTIIGSAINQSVNVLDAADLHLGGFGIANRVLTAAEIGELTEQCFESAQLPNTGLLNARWNARSGAHNVGALTTQWLDEVSGAAVTRAVTGARTLTSAARLPGWQ